MNEEFKKFLSELHEKEAEEGLSGRFFKEPLKVVYPNGDTLVPIEAKKRFPIRDLERYVDIHGIDYFKEMVVKDMMGDVLRMLDEMGLIELNARIAKMDSVEFKITLKVLKDATKSAEGRGYNPDKLPNWTL